MPEFALELSVVPFYKSSSRAIDFSTLVNSGSDAGIILETISLGSLHATSMLNETAAAFAATVSAKTNTATYRMKGVLRDSTIQASATVTDFIAATALFPSLSFSINGAGSFYTDDFFEVFQKSQGDSDGYGNTIAVDDELVIDIGILVLNQDNTNVTGTFDVDMHFEADLIS
jgi:hypothetical protein